MSAISLSLCMYIRTYICTYLFTNTQLCLCLYMKAIQCIIILNSILASPQNCQVGKDWLAVICPGWQLISVCNAAKCRGFVCRDFAGSPAGKRPSRNSRIGAVRSVLCICQLTLLRGNLLARLCLYLHTLHSCPSAPEFQKSRYECGYASAAYVLELVKLCVSIWLRLLRRTQVP